MIKKFVFSSCLALVLFYGDCWGMERAKSEPSLRASMDHTETIRPSSTPVTAREIQEAISKWAHLVPENATTTQVNKALQEAIIHIESAPGCRHEMEVLVELICSPDDRSIYANYVHMVFVSALPDCNDEERNKFGGMLAGIAGSKGGTASLFWNWYAKGYFDSVPSEVE